jgi:hypothetical protein
VVFSAAISFELNVDSKLLTILRPQGLNMKYFDINMGGLKFFKEYVRTHAGPGLKGLTAII